MADIRVDSIYNVEALQAEAEQVISMLTSSKNAILDLNNQRVNLKSADVSSFTQASQQLNQTINESVTATQKATVANQQLTQAQVAARLANQQRTQAIKDDILQNQAAIGSYNALQLQLKSLTAQYKALSQAEREGAQGQALQKQILDTNNQLKSLDANIGNYQRNVGNYGGEIKKLAMGFRGLGGLGVILSKALGIDPETANIIRETGMALRDYGHAQDLTTAGAKDKAAATTLSEEATMGETEATTVNTTAQEANKVAQVEGTTATELQTTALESETGAAEGATVATEGLSEALGASGIGAVVIGAIAIIAGLVKVITDWNAAEAEQQQAAETLKTVIGELISSYKAYDDLLTVTAANQLKSLTDRIALQKSAGVGALEALALDKQVADQELANATARANRVGADKASYEAAKSQAEGTALALEQAELKKQQILKQTAEGYANANSAQQLYLDASAKALDKQIEELKKESSADAEQFSFIKGIFDAKIEAVQKSEDAQTKITKLSADERRQYDLIEAQTSLEITQSYNEKILQSDASTQAQKLAALKSNQAAQLAVINKTLQNTINDPTKKDQIPEAQKQAEAARVKLKNDTEKKINDTIIYYTDRDLKAQADYNNAVLNLDKEFAASRINTDMFDVDQNMRLIQQEGKDELGVLENNYNLQLALGMKFNAQGVLEQTLTQEQQLALKTNYDSARLKAEADTDKKITDTLINSYEEQIKATQKLQQEMQSAKNTHTTASADAQDLQAYQAFADGKIKKEEDLNHTIEQNDLKANLQILANDEQYYQDKLDKLIQAGNQESLEAQTIEDEITKNQKDQAQARQKIIDNEVKYKEGKLKEFMNTALEVSKELFQDAQTIGDNRFDAEKAQIQKEQDLLNTQTQHQIDLENASVDSADQKTAKIAIINARAQAQKEALDKKAAKADHDKAEFDKAIAIGGIIVNTLATVAKITAAAALIKASYAVAAAQMLALNPITGAALAPALIAAGNIQAATVTAQLPIVFAESALQIAAAASAPVPGYRMGRGEGSAEFAMVGDGGISEYVYRASSGRIEKTPAVDTLTYLMPKDKVYKDKEALMNELAMGNISGVPSHISNIQGIDKSDIKSMTNEIVGAVSDIKIHTQIITKSGWRTHNERIAKYDAWVNKYIKN